MDRSFSQRQEIDCTCFDFHIHDHPLSRHRETSSKPFLHARQLNTNFQQITKQKKLLNSSMKKSLKNKNLNQSLKQQPTNHRRDCQKENNKIMRNQSTNTDWISEDKWIILAQGSIIEKQRNKQNQKSLETIFVESKNQKYQQKIQKDDTHQEPKKLNAEKKSDIAQRKILIQLFQTKIEPKMQHSAEVFKKNKTSIHYTEPSEVGSYQKTIKKKHSILSSIYDATQKKENKKTVDYQSVKKLKKLSIRGDTGGNFIKNLKHILPKQIESFDEDNFSVTESEVIQRGRNTWAPENQKKAQGLLFISSLHIKNTDRASKLSTNRPSKMVQTNI